VLSGEATNNIRFSPKQETRFEFRGKVIEVELSFCAAVFVYLLKKTSKLFNWCSSFAMSVPQILIFMLRHWFTCSQKPLVYFSLFITQLTVPDECPAAQKLSSTSVLT
jgi:hypothetical protein